MTLQNNWKNLYENQLAKEEKITNVLDRALLELLYENSWFIEYMHISVVAKNGKSIFRKKCEFEILAPKLKNVLKIKEYIIQRNNFATILIDLSFIPVIQLLRKIIYGYKHKITEILKFIDGHAQISYLVYIFHLLWMNIQIEFDISDILIKSDIRENWILKTSWGRLIELSINSWTYSILMM